MVSRCPGRSVVDGDEKLAVTRYGEHLASRYAANPLKLSGKTEMRVSFDMDRARESKKGNYFDRTSKASQIVSNCVP